MRDIKRLCEKIETELSNIAEKGLTTGNIDTAYKLIDMYKDIKNTEYWETKGEYYETVLEEMQRGEYSNKRDSYGRYSRDGERSMMQDYDNESSYRGRRRGEHYVRGHYSRNGSSDGYSGNNYERYMDSKQAYRSGGSQECKQKLMSTLEDYMDDFSHQMEEMLRDSECKEEKETIERYLRKLQNLI